MEILDNEQIIEGVLAGTSLRTFMVPDSSIPTNNPVHHECYALPHVIILGDQFWGKTTSTHVSCVKGREVPYPCAFCYTSFREMFFSFIPHASSGVFMSKKRYKIHNWILKPNSKLIWDSQRNDDPKVIDEVIHTSSKLKIALQDEQEVWHIHPVDLPMYFPETNSFSLKTEYDVYPSDFRRIEAIQQVYDKLFDFFEIKPTSNADGCIPFKSKPFVPVYEIYHDMTYRHYNDFNDDNIRTYRQLKIFADT